MSVLMGLNLYSSWACGKQSLWSRHHSLLVNVFTVRAQLTCTASKFSSDSENSLSVYGDGPCKHRCRVESVWEAGEPGALITVSDHVDSEEG